MDTRWLVTLKERGSLGYTRLSQSTTLNAALR